MKKFIKLFPAVALLMGVSFAFANASNARMLVPQKQAFINNAWQNISATQSYTCAGETSNCTRLVENGTVVPGSLVKGVYSAE